MLYYADNRNQFKNHYIINHVFNWEIATKLSTNRHTTTQVINNIQLKC